MELPIQIWTKHGKNKNILRRSRTRVRAWHQRVSLLFQQSPKSKIMGRYVPSRLVSSTIASPFSYFHLLPQFWETDDDKYLPPSAIPNPLPKELSTCKLPICCDNHPHHTWFAGLRRFKPFFPHVKHSGDGVRVTQKAEDLKIAGKLIEHIDLHQNSYGKLSHFGLASQLPRLTGLVLAWFPRSPK